MHFKMCSCFLTESFSNIVSGRCAINDSANLRTVIIFKNKLKNQKQNRLLHTAAIKSLERIMLFGNKLS